jgi:hypothetical protein
MKTFKIDGKLGKFEITLPEELSEISNEYLAECTKFVHPAKDYALVGVVSKENLNVILTAARKNQSVNVPIIPIFIKAGDTDCELVKNLKIGTRVVVAGSDLSIGNHINSPYNHITTTNIVRICEGDRNITRETLVLNRPVCFLEFKLVPVSAIHAVLDVTPNKYEDPFIKPIKDDNEVKEVMN